MFDSFASLIQPNPTINFDKLVAALFPDGVPAPTPGTDETFQDLADQIIQTLEGGELTYGDNTWYCDVYAFLSIMVCYLQEDDVWIDPRVGRIYDAIEELAESGKIHLIDLSS